MAEAVALVVSVNPKPDVMHQLRPLAKAMPAPPPSETENPLSDGGISIAKITPVAELHPLNPVPASYRRR